LKIDKLTLGSFGVNCYLLSSGKKAVIIDPGADFKKIEKYILIQKLHPVAIINTHGHYDHIGAANELAEKFHLDFYIHPGDKQLLKDPGLNLSLMLCSKPYVLEDFKLIDSEAIDFFYKQGINIIHTPGHTPGHITMIADHFMFCGDLLFMGAIGRTDLPGGDMQKIKNSLKKIRKMDKNLVIYPGHGQRTILGMELENNYYLSDNFLGKG
jgi:glyoxylase-like metal-dependent hydrolase (beta-lactamase superfamily II)